MSVRETKAYLILDDLSIPGEACLYGHAPGVWDTVFTDTPIYNNNNNIIIITIITIISYWLQQ